MGQLTYFLGLKIAYKPNGDSFDNPLKYIKDLIYKAGMDSCKPAPLDQMLISYGPIMSNASLYRSIVGSL